MAITLTHPPKRLQTGAPRPAVGSTLANAMKAVWSWRRNQKHRAELRALLERADDRMLSDVGLTRSVVADEAGKPFWRD